MSYRLRSVYRRIKGHGEQLGRNTKYDGTLNMGTARLNECQLLRYCVARELMSTYRTEMEDGLTLSLAKGIEGVCLILLTRRLCSVLGF